MTRPRKGVRTRSALTPIPLDPEQTLFEVPTRDLWQSALYASDGTVVGRVIRQVIEARMYTIRYLVIYAPAEGRHFVVPSSAITDIEPNEVRCNLDVDRLRQLPDFGRALSRHDEELVFSTLGRTPYWIEEAPYLDNP